MASIKVSSIGGLACTNDSLCPCKGRMRGTDGRKITWPFKEKISGYYQNKVLIIHQFTSLYHAETNNDKTV